MSIQYTMTINISNLESKLLIDQLLGLSNNNVLLVTQQSLISVIKQFRNLFQVLTDKIF